MPMTLLTQLDNNGDLIATHSLALNDAQTKIRHLEQEIQAEKALSQELAQDLHLRSEEALILEETLRKLASQTDRMQLALGSGSSAFRK